MDITEEIINNNNFTEDQVAAIKSFGDDQLNKSIEERLPDIEKRIEDKYKTTANENAQNIIGSAASGIQELTGFRDREKGEHLESYTKLAWEHKAKLSEGNAQKAENNNDELNALKEKYDALQAKEASFDELLSSGIKDNYESLLKENETTKIDSAFTNVLPSFPDGVNEYEKRGKWGEFKSSVLDKYKIEKVDNEYYAIDKENIHRQIKLSELVSKDASIQELLKGRQQTGTGAQPVSEKKIEGVPFDVPLNADSITKTKLTQEYLAKENIPVTSNQYAVKFQEIYSKLVAAA